MYGLVLEVGLGLFMHTLAGVVSILREVYKSGTGQHVFPKLCKHVHKPFSTHLSQKMSK